MNHLSAVELYTLVFDDALPTAADRLHLQECATCQQAVQALQIMARELAVARRSAPSPAAQQRYASLFAQVQRQPSPLQQFWQGVRAALTWDSRQQPAWQGVRSVAAAAYRLLYETDQAAIELMVESHQGLRRIEGDVAPNADSESAPLPALVELIAAGAASQYETVTDDSGRFHLDAVAPGAYDLLLTLADGTVLIVQALEIT